MQFSSLKRAHASVLIPEHFCFTILHLYSGSWCLANLKHTMTKHDSLGDANSVLEKGGKQASGTWCQMKLGHPRSSWGTHTREHILGVSGDPNIENLAAEVDAGSGTEISAFLITSDMTESYWELIDRYQMNVASSLHQIWVSRQRGSMLPGASGPNMVILGPLDLVFMPSLNPADMMKP